MAPSEESPLEKLLRDAAPTLSLEERDRVMLECGRRDAMRGKIGVGIASSLATAASLLGWLAIWRPFTFQPETNVDRTANVDVIEEAGFQPERSQRVLRETNSNSLVHGVWTAGFRPQRLAQIESRMMTDKPPAKDAAAPAVNSGRILKAADRDLPDWL